MRSDWTLPICNGKERLKKWKKNPFTKTRGSLQNNLKLPQTKMMPSLIPLGTGTTAVVAKN